MKSLTNVFGRIVGAAAMVAGLMLVPSTTEASTISYSVDTSSLNPLAGVYSLDFQLLSSDANGANSATIYNVVVTGGGLLGSLYYPPAGNVTGGLPSGVTLTTTDAVNTYTQDFTVGSMLSFLVDLTNVAPTGLIPDAFSFAILLDGVEVTTLDPSGSNKLLQLDLVGGGSFGGGGSFALAAAAPVPEPSTYVLTGFGMLLVFGLRQRRRA